MFDRELTIPTESSLLPGHLCLPERPRGLLVFAHGSDVGRDPTRDRALAEAIAGKDLGLVTAELLWGMHGDQAAESQRRHALHVLTQRLVATCDWLASQPETMGLPLGLFGVELGAGAALSAAVARPETVSSVVTWNGRMELVGADLLGRLRVPTLMLVGDGNSEALRAAEAAGLHLSAPRGIKIVSGGFLGRTSTHDQISTAARSWFTNHLHGERHGAVSLADDGVRSV